MITVMAKGLGLMVVAEGAETRRQSNPCCNGGATTCRAILLPVADSGRGHAGDCTDQQELQRHDHSHLVWSLQ